MDNWHQNSCRIFPVFQVKLAKAVTKTTDMVVSLLGTSETRERRGRIVSREAGWKPDDGGHF